MCTKGLNDTRGVSVLLRTTGLLRSGSSVRFLIFKTRGRTRPCVAGTGRVRLSGLGFLPLRPCRGISYICDLNSITIMSYGRKFKSVTVPDGA